MVCFNPDKKVIFIHLPKCAGISVETILRKQFGFISFTFPHSKDNYKFLRDSRGKIGILRFILLYSNEAKLYDLNSFKKITVVRNPYNRCESAIRYLHKISNEGEKFPTNIKEFYYTSLERHYYYMHFCLTQKQSLEDLEGNINIDYICKFETLFEDLEYALFEVCNFDRIEIKRIHVNKTDKEILLLDRKEISELILQLHKEDFEQFDYSTIDMNLSK